MRKLMNKRGQVIDSVTATIIAVFVALLAIFGILYGISVLNPPSFFTTGTAAYNATIALQDNGTMLAQNFSQRLPTAGTIFGVVLILAVLAILIMYVVRFRQTSQGGYGGGAL